MESPETLQQHALLSRDDLRVFRFWKKVLVKKLAILQTFFLKISALILDGTSMFIDGAHTWVHGFSWNFTTTCHMFQRYVQFFSSWKKWNLAILRLFFRQCFSRIKIHCIRGQNSKTVEWIHLIPYNSMTCIHGMMFILSDRSQNKSKLAISLPFV